MSIKNKKGVKNQDLWIDYVRDGKLIDAIKILREQRNISLKEAYDIVKEKQNDLTRIE